MTTRLEVESAIKQLPESEVRDLAKWIQEYLDEKWDQQIEKVGKQLWSACISGGYRALALKKGDDYYWFWIGNHDQYENFLN